MALPADYQTGTVTGRWVGLDGVPMQGTVTFEAQVSRMSSPATNTIVVAFKVVATLNVSGEISQALPATDDPHISPVDFTYKVTESFNQGQARTYHILVPHSTTTDLADVISISANTGVTITKGDPGPALTPKGSVANAAALPGSGNTEGDLYVTEDTHTFYAWNGSGWVDMGEIGPTDGSAATPSLRTLGTGSTQAAQGSALATLTTTVAGKEDVGVAAAAVADLPEVADGIGNKIDTGTAGLVKYNRASFAFALNSGVTNTTTETSNLTTVLALPASYVAIGTQFEVVLIGQYTNNSGSNRDFTLRVKIGTNTLLTFALTAIPTSATVRNFLVRATVGFIDIAGLATMGMGSMSMSAAGAGADFALQTVYGFTFGAPTVNTASSMNVTLQHSAAHANLNAGMTPISHVRPGVVF